MDFVFDVFQKNRKNILSILEFHSLDEVNRIPRGLNNNLLWNGGHILIAQYYLTYYLSGLPIEESVQKRMVKYGSDTRPDGRSGQEEKEWVIANLRSSTDALIEDYGKKRFTGFKGYVSEYFGMELKTIDEALVFNTFHEGVHFGHMAAIRSALASG